MLHVEVRAATWLLGSIQTNWTLRTFRITYFYFVMSSIHYYNYQREFIGLTVKQSIPRIQADIFLFAPFINSINALFINPTDAHNYNHRNVKTIKIPTIAPTCFGSRRNHHQGAIS